MDMGAEDKWAGWAEERSRNACPVWEADMELAACNNSSLDRVKLVLLAKKAKNLCLNMMHAKGLLPSKNPTLK